MDRLRASETGDRLRAERSLTFDALKPWAGARLLDIGCGTGEDVHRLRDLAGHGGRAVGVDSSMRMLRECRRRTDQPVLVAAADAHRLPFPGGTFDGCRAERVLQHVADPRAVLVEVARVLRPGGRIALLEPDWGTLVVDSADPRTTRSILNAKADRICHGGIGRTLRRLLCRAGFVDVEVRLTAGHHDCFELANAVLGLDAAANFAREQRVVTASEAEAWRDGLRRADAEGVFFAALMRFTFAATRP
jgi:SAM-dependent methyltransferase